MENKEFEGKKLELLSEEELLKVCGGASELPEAMKEALNKICVGATVSEELCKTYEFCTWQGGTWGPGRCQLKDDLKK